MPILGDEYMVRHSANFTTSSYKGHLISMDIETDITNALPIIRFNTTLAVIINLNYYSLRR